MHNIVPTNLGPSPAQNQPILMVCSKAPPYLEFIAELLALPEGANYHFRYRKRWVPANFWSNPNELYFRDAIILFLGDLGESPPIVEYVPVRHARITRARKLGEHLRIDFTVGPFAKYHIDTPAGQPNEYSVNLNRVFEQANAANHVQKGYDGEFVVPVTYNFIDMGREPEDWVRVVREVVRFPGFTAPKATIFLSSNWIEGAPKGPVKESRLDGRHSRYRESDTVKTLFDADGNLVLHADRTYELHITE